LSLLKPGGRIIFLSPSTNHVDHGFYMFLPTLFMDYLLANGFSIRTFYFIRYSLNSRKRRRAYAYERDSSAFLDRNPRFTRLYELCGGHKNTRRDNRQNSAANVLFGPMGEQDGLRTKGRFARLEAILSRIPGALDLAIAVWPLVARRGRWGLRYVGKF